MGFEKVFLLSFYGVNIIYDNYRRYSVSMYKSLNGMLIASLNIFFRIFAHQKILKIFLSFCCGCGNMRPGNIKFPRRDYRIFEIMKES